MNSCGQRVHRSSCREEPGRHLLQTLRSGMRRTSANDRPGTLLRVTGPWTSRLEGALPMHFATMFLYLSRRSGGRRGRSLLLQDLGEPRPPAHRACGAG
ncbi:Pacrg [Symbiodinium microadriaticum]|nr:Pacrg [Symbiodinium microadriaticum]CAE7942240.1 Pacrg [Symbiodinium sp. KB8]